MPALVPLAIPGEGQVVLLVSSALIDFNDVSLNTVVPRGRCSGDSSHAMRLTHLAVRNPFRLHDAKGA